MDLFQTKDFIDALPLQAPGHEFVRTGLATRSAPKGGIEQSFLSDKSVISFTPGVSMQQRIDVLNSTLLAQLAANHKFPDPGDLSSWYKVFIDVLSKTGWFIPSSEFKDHHFKEDDFEVDSEILDIIGKSFAGNLLEILKTSLESLKKLSEGDGKLTVFEKNTRAVSNSSFQLAAVAVEEGKVIINLAAFIVNSRSHITKILFFKATRNETNLKYTSNKGQLNEDAYFAIREQVRAKLADRASKFITGLDI